jgi:hypothetical protein
VSKKGKKVRAEKRKAEKRKKKEARKQQYLSFAREGKVKGSARARSKRHYAPSKDHKAAFAAYCGNDACDACHYETALKRVRRPGRIDP